MANDGWDTGNAVLGARPWWRRKRIWLVLVAVYLLVPFYRWLPVQDSCSYGPVTNTMYRQYRNEAIEWAKETGYRWPWTVRAIHPNTYFRTFVDKGANTAERVARAHAAARATGAIMKAYNSEDREKSKGITLWYENNHWIPIPIPINFKNYFFQAFNLIFRSGENYGNTEFYNDWGPVWPGAFPQYSLKEQGPCLGDTMWGHDLLPKEPAK